MNKSIFDVMIAGAGPAGLMAAKKASELGLDVCVVEIKKDFNKVERACSMQFIMDEGYEGESMQVTNDKLIFPKNQFSVDYHGDIVPVYNKYYHSPSDHIIHFSNSSKDTQEPFAIKFDKQKLLAGLYESCLGENVTFYLNTHALHGKDYDDYVELEVATGGKHQTLYSKKLIIAEGVNARLSETFGLGSTRTHFATAHTVKYFLEGVKGIEPNSWNLFYGTVYHSNVPVIIGPSLQGDHILEMTVTGDSYRKPDQIYQELFQSGPLSSLLKDSKLIKKNGCTLKALSSLKTPYKGNVLAIGDTAAFVEVETQGALMCGYHAAESIAEELKGNPGFETYTKWWVDSFEFNSEDYLKVSQGYALVPTYTDKELDYLFALIEEEQLEGTYSQYKTPKLIWEAILTHKERIQSEQPAIYAKILKMNQLTLGDSLKK